MHATNRLTLILASMVLGISLIAGTLAWSPAFADEGRQRLDGSWVATVTATNPPLGSFTSLMTFTRSGGVVESRRLYVADSPFGPLLETPGHGAWVRTGKRKFSIAFTFLLQGAPDNPEFAGESIGTDNIRLNVGLSRTGDTLSGDFVSEIRDLDGNLLLAVEGSIEAKPILVETNPSHPPE